MAQRKHIEDETKEKIGKAKHERIEKQRKRNRLEGQRTIKGEKTKPHRHEEHRDK